MKYEKPFGEFIEFDNSDIIVTSKLNPQRCNAWQAGIVCAPNADDSLPNACGYDGISDSSCPTEAQGAYVYFCYAVTWIAPTPEWCSAAVGNHDFQNSIDPPGFDF